MPIGSMVVRLNFMILAAVTMTACSNRVIPEKTIYSRYNQQIFRPSFKSEIWYSGICTGIKGESSGSENNMLLFSEWNRDSLYFFFRVEDHDLRAYQKEQDHARLYLDDMAELLLDTRNDKDSCWAEDDIVYHVNILGVKKDDRGSAACETNPAWNGTAELGIYLEGTLNDTLDTDSGYTVTLAFPWTEIGRKPGKGLTMGINFANGDNDGKGRQLFDWAGAWPMRSPWAYGNLVLIKKQRISD